MSYSLWRRPPQNLALGSVLCLFAGGLVACIPEEEQAPDASTSGSSSGGSTSGSSSGGSSGSRSGSSGGSSSSGSSSGGSSSGSGSSSGGSSSGGSSGSGDSTPSAGCGKARTLQNGTITIESKGSRSYLLKVPDNYDNTHPYRLIFAFHWLGGKASDVAGTYGWYGLWNLASNSTIFVAPQGLSSGSSTGWSNSNGDDIALTDAILAQVEADLCIDKSQIFSNGFSFGAAMSFAVACARANVFRGVALYSGAQISGCSGGTTPIACLQAHGLSDSALPISGARTMRDKYASVNGCTAQTPPEPTKGSGTHTCTTYQGCSEGHPLTWCAFDGDHNPSPRDSGQSSSWLPQKVWDFIKQF